MKIMSWNVNGLQACCKERAFQKAVLELNPDIVCVQETKTKKKELDELDDYYQIWNNARREGYAGVMVLTKVEPISYRGGFGVEEFDIEGRLLTLEYPEFFLLNVYVPQSKNSKKKADMRKRWDKHFREYVKTLHKPVIMCGDFNIGHAAIDIMSTTSKDNPQTVGFEQIDRENFDKLLDLGYVDVYRKKYPNKARFTCWSNKRYNKTRCMDKRLDYFLLPTDMMKKVKKISMHYHIMASDHCPITMQIKTSFAFRQSNKDKKLSEQWDKADWEYLEKGLYLKQKAIAKGTKYKEFSKVTQLQEKLTNSLSARMLAVRHVSESTSEAGVDGMVWSTSARKMEAVHSLDNKMYHSQVFRSVMIQDKGGRKERRINIPTYYDRAMQALHAYALAPVVETLADKTSFGLRKGRSALDAASYVAQALSDAEFPLYVLKCDVKSFYDTISHAWLLENVPMNKTVLREFLKSGFSLDGVIHESEMGISQGSGISGTIANFVLDGLQKHILKGLYGKKWNTEEYQIGRMIRFADDFIIVARTKPQAKNIQASVEVFLETRGLRLSQEKTEIVKATDGFDFLSYHFCQKGYFCTVTPSDSAIRTYEKRLEAIIMNSKSSVDTLIRTLNKSLQGFATYHRIHDCEKEFRHIDVAVQGLLVKKIRVSFPTQNWKKLQAQYWYRNPDGNHSFTDPNNKTLRVISLGKIVVRNHHAVREDFNCFLDEDYYKTLEKQRDVQKVTGKTNKGIWTGQDGHCFYCGKVMLPDQLCALVRVGDKEQYIHENCKNNIFEYVEADINADGLDLLHLLESVLHYQHEEQDPYYCLRQFFLDETRQKFTLTFREIEEIIGEPLPSEAKFSERFWLDFGFGYWEDDNFPYHAVQYTDFTVQIAGSWVENGYKILKLDKIKEKIVFQKVNHAITKLNIPPRLVEAKISKDAAHEIDTFFRYIKDRYGY